MCEVYLIVIHNIGNNAVVFTPEFILVGCNQR